MSGLTGFLQRGFAESLPLGWTSRSEVGLVSPRTEALLGYAPRADVVLERTDGSRRIWVEFEISRADPVANHAKFATVHLFEPQLFSDTFLAMVSPHVARGRRNLAANMVAVMRTLGMSAFQTVLFPGMEPDQVKVLNHSSAEVVAAAGLPVAEELEKALSVVDCLFEVKGQRIHFAADPFEVLRNVSKWNAEMMDAQGRASWGTRTITYFVFDPWTECFAPSKFCAYVPVPTRGEALSRGALGPRNWMSSALYSGIPEDAPSFDGNKAWCHLCKGLGFRVADFRREDKLSRNFNSWLGSHRDVVRLHPAAPIVLVPPPWFR